MERPGRPGGAPSGQPRLGAPKTLAQPGRPALPRARPHFLPAPALRRRSGPQRAPPGGSGLLPVPSPRRPPSTACAQHHQEAHVPRLSPPCAGISAEGLPDHSSGRKGQSGSSPSHTSPAEAPSGCLGPSRLQQSRSRVRLYARGSPSLLPSWTHAPPASAKAAAPALLPEHAAQLSGPLLSPVPSAPRVSTPIQTERKQHSQQAGSGPRRLSQSYPSPKPEPGSRGRSAPRAETVRINPEATTQGLTLPSRTLASEGKEPMTSCKAPLFSLYGETQQSEAQEAGCGDMGWPWASSPPGVLQAPPDSNHWACFYVI